MTKKLDLVYLANDLISKSSTRVQLDPDTPFNNFHKALSPPVLKEVFTLLFKIICTPATKDSAKHLIQQILKVISRWESREYTGEELGQLKVELEAMSG